MRISFLITFLFCALVNGLPFSVQARNKQASNNLRTRNPPEPELTYTFNEGGFDYSGKYIFTLHGKGWNSKGVKTRLQRALTRPIVKGRRTYLLGLITGGQETENGWDLKFEVKLDEDEKFDDVKKIVENAVTASFLKKISRQ